VTPTGGGLCIRYAPRLAGYSPAVKSTSERIGRTATARPIPAPAIADALEILKYNPLREMTAQEKFECDEE